MLECMAIAAAVVVTAPVLVFFCVKLGRYAWLAADAQFARNQSKGQRG